MNYEQMEPLFNKYKADGFAIAAFPCNQFGNQEPGTAAEIKEFARVKYGATYDLFDKIDVNGDGAHPLYKYLKSVQGGTLGSFIKWNFTKFLVDRNGVPIKRYSPTTDPKEVEPDVVKALATPAKQ